MRWFWQNAPMLPETKEASLESLLRQVAMLYETTSGASVNPETCMQSPTVHSIVTAVQNRLAISPIKVMQRGLTNGRPSKTDLPQHSIAKLLRAPNTWQTDDEYVGDAASSLMRYGRYHARILRGATGPIRFLEPLDAGEVNIRKDDNLQITFEHKGKVIPQARMHYARLGARDYLRGDSPVVDVREAIGLEIAAEKFGAAFYGNGALPLMYFKLMEGFQDFKTTEAAQDFLNKFKEAFSGNKKFSTMMLPKGMEIGQVQVENNKAQFLETRRYQRTVIAGAFGVPPHLVGDLERATFNNVEQQDTDFIINVILPVARRLESAMERDLLTPADRSAGVIIRFDLDAVDRGDIKARNEALKTAREWGAINANEWREKLGLNPISDKDGGEDYIRPMNMAEAGAEPPPPPEPPPQIELPEGDEDVP